MTDYKQLMTDLDTYLAERSPASSKALRTHFERQGWPRWQIDNCLGYIGAIREPGPTPYAPGRVWHPSDPNAPTPAVDTWLREQLGEAGTIPSTVLYDRLKTSVHSRAALDQAMVRLGVTSVKNADGWHKSLPDVPVPAAAGTHATPEQINRVCEIITDLPDTLSLTELIRILQLERVVSRESMSDATGVVRAAVTALGEKVTYDRTSRTFGVQ